MQDGKEGHTLWDLIPPLPIERLKSVEICIILNYQCCLGVNLAICRFIYLI